MGYTIGVSSGMFMTASQEEKESFLTVPRKVFRGGLEGVNFTQIDIESITEFNEPNVVEEIKRIKGMGIRFGVHGESYAMGGTEKPISMLDSAIETEYIHAHERLIQHIEGCGKIGAEYVNIHPSETFPFIRLGVHLQPTRLVDFWGRPLGVFLKENKKIFDWAVEQDFLSEIFMHRYRHITVSQALKANIEDFKRREKREPSKEEIEDLKKQIKEEFKQYLLNFVSTSDLAYGAEKVAYFIIAKWMQENNDPLWKNIVGKKIKDDKLPEKHKEWVPAVSAKYIWGHFNPKEKDKFKDPKPLLEKYRLYFVFETQMGTSGLEGLQRLTRPRDMIFLCQAIKSDWVGVCFDFEHVLAQNIDPKKEIESIPYGLAKYVKVCHLGFPTPHVPAHMPIPLGSEAQLYLYERLYELRKKGFKEGWLIFERGAAPRQQSILVLRLLKEYLEKDTPPKELPLEFFGMKEKGPDLKRQEVAIKEHALDPLKRMLAIPEEEYTFLSQAAVKKGKGAEWEKEKYR
jgi:sugar phosphate isomerase/epimerase